MFHPFYNQFSNEFLDLSSAQLGTAQVTLPFFRPKKRDPVLAICKVALLEDDITHGQYGEALIEHFCRCTSAEGRVSGSLKLVGEDPFRRHNRLYQYCSRYPKTTRSIITTALNTAVTDITKMRSQTKLFLGVTYAAINTGGYVIYKGKCAPFNATWRRHHRAFRLVEVCDEIPYILQKNEVPKHHRFGPVATHAVV